MLGWLITVYRCGSRTLREARGDADAMRSVLVETTGAPTVSESTDADARIATWQTGLGGTAWLTHLVTRGRALSTSRGGYPDTYLIHCRDFATRLDEGLPEEHSAWIAGVDDILTDRWLGRTTIDTEMLAQCDPDEWLLVTVWDES